MKTTLKEFSDWYSKKNIQDYNEKVQVASWSWFYQQDKIDKLAEENKRLREALQFVELCVDHSKECRYPFEECSCMNRQCYNEKLALSSIVKALKDKE